MALNIFYSVLYHSQAAPGTTTSTTTTRMLCRMFFNMFLKHGPNIEINSIHQNNLTEILRLILTARLLLILRIKHLTVLEPQQIAG